MDFSVTGGAGSIVSTPTDMTKFIQALFDLKLVSAAQPQADDNDEGRRGHGNGILLVRGQDPLREHGRERQLWSMAGLLIRKKSWPSPMRRT